MKSNRSIEKILAFATLLVIAFFAAEKSLAQCGTNFKTGYRKIVTGFGDYKLEDWNGDGKLDFWVFRLNPNTLKQDVYVFPNNGSGDWNWNNPVVYATTIPEFTGSDDIISVIDFDGDGDKDIFFVQARSFHTLYKNNGNGTFTASATQTFSDAQVLRTVGFVDLNNDNRLDWIQHVNHPGVGNPISYRLANADGTFGAIADIAATADTFGSTQFLGDFNGDGKTDIVYTGGGQYRLLINNGGGNFTVGSPVSMGGVTNYFISAKDFNNDGRDDILVQRGTDSSPNATTRKVFVYYGQANGSLIATEYPVNVPGVGANIRVGEFNGDNKPDFIESYSGSDAIPPPFYSVYTNDGAGGFTRIDYAKSLGDGTFILADLNGDNKTDIFLPIRNSRYIGNIFGDQVIIIRYNQCQPFGEVKKANFDRNSREDLAAWNPATGEWRSTDAIWGTSNPSFKTFNWGSGALGDIPAPGDFDGDGTTDYAVYRNGEGNWYIYQSSNGNWLTVKFGLPGDIPVPNDYDGGGKTDIAVFRPSDGNWYIWSSEAQQFSAVHFGANGDKPVAQDYDGDGKTDVAVFRPSEGNWYYLKSSDGNYAVFHWGISTDKPLPADYDGDGRADLAIYRGAGDWYILRSSDNSFNYIKWGTGSDVPMPIYENGESAAPVVYRPSLAYWMSYTDPNAAFILGGTGYVPVYFGLPNN